MPEQPIKLVMESVKIAPHIGTPLNKYLLVHLCTNPEMPEKSAGGLFLPGENPMMSCMVIDRSPDCTMDIGIGDVVYLSSGDACPALPININHDRFMLVQEIYVAYRIKREAITVDVEGTQIKVIQGVATATPAAAKAMEEAAKAAAKGLRV